MAERKILYIVLSAVLAAAYPRLVAQTQGLEAADQWGKAFDGVQLALYFDPHPLENSSMPLLRIAIRNDGTSPKKIVLGGGCGGVNETNAIALDITDGQRQRRQFQDMTANVPCAGRLQLFEVALPAGGYLSTPLSLKHYGYISPVTHTFEVGFQQGASYVISASVPFDTSAGFFAESLIPLTHSPPGASPSYEMPAQVPIAQIPERLTSNELRVDIPAQ